MRSSDGEGRSIRSDALSPGGEWEVPVTRNAKITPVNEGGGGAGSGGPPLRDHLWQGPPLPVTLRLIHPPPKMTQGVMTTLTPLHRLSTASLSGVVRAFAYHRYFRFFLSLFFSTPLNEFFQIQPYLITDFDCWLCYFRYSLSTQTLRAAPGRSCSARSAISSARFAWLIAALKWPHSTKANTNHIRFTTDGITIKSRNSSGGNSRLSASSLGACRYSPRA